jgi:hypothetical protein
MQQHTHNTGLLLPFPGGLLKTTTAYHGIVEDATIFRQLLQKKAAVPRNNCFS